MRVTLNDIAQATGFSVSTVSRTLRGKGNTTETNERAILQKAKELNYPLYQGIETNFTQKGQFVALIAGLHPGEFYTSFFEGFVKAGDEKGIDVAMFNAPSEVDNLIDLIKRLRASACCSAVLMIPALHQQDYQKILREIPSTFPLISSSNIVHPIMDTVTFNGYKGSSLVAQHFIDRGYKTLGLINGPSNKPEALFRKNGFTDTVDQSSEADFIWSFPGDYSPESGKQAFEKYDRLQIKPRAIFAANDASAFGFMEAARAKGYSLPEDIALAGYDDLPQSSLHFPSLTSVQTNYKNLASVALDVLFERLSSPKSHQGLVSSVTVNLIIRQTS